MRDTVGNNQPNLEGIAGDIRGFLPGLGAQAFGPNPLLDAGNNYVTDTLGGRYLDQANPYLQGMINSTGNDVSDRVNSMFAKSGASLGTSHAGVLTSELAQAENALRYGNYAQERQNQQSAAGMVPGLNSAQYAGVAPYIGAATAAGTLPYAGVGALSPIIGLGGGAGTQTGTQPGGWGNGILGALGGLGAAALGNPAIFSSARELKADITELGAWDDRGDGLKRYRFRYKNDPDKQMVEGVMADEVKALRPWAYVPNFTQGKPGVNYAKLGDAA